MSEEHFIIQSCVRWRNPFNGSTEDKSTFITIEGQTLDNFKIFQEKLGIVDSQHFAFQYFDEDDDLITISSENEFKEFAKVVKKRTFKGMVTRLLVTCNVPLEDEEKPNQEPIETTGLKEKLAVEAKTLDVTPAAALPEPKRKTSAPSKDQNGDSYLIQLRDRVDELMKNSGSYTDMNQPHVSSSGLVAIHPLVSSTARGLDEQRKEICVISKVKKNKKDKPKTDKPFRFFMPSQQFPESLVPSKIQSEKLPSIMSGEASKESFRLSNAVVVGKSFTHAWTIINDGTVPWGHVELRHIWSSPELEPRTKSIECPPLLPGQVGQLVVKFRAPKSVKQFISFWHFYYEVNSQWMQFGHYVSITGVTKVKKDAISEEASVVVLCQGKSSVNPNNVRMSVTFENENNLDKQLDGSLASAKIAAEMEKEAARIAKESANKESCNGIMKSTMAHEKVTMTDCGRNSSGSDNETDEEANSRADFEFVTIENCEGNNANENREVQSSKENSKLVVPHRSNVKVEDKNTNVPAPLQQNASVDEVSRATVGSSTYSRHPPPKHGWYQQMQHDFKMHHHRNDLYDTISSQPIIHHPYPIIPQPPPTVLTTHREFVSQPRFYTVVQQGPTPAADVSQVGIVQPSLVATSPAVITDNQLIDVPANQESGTVHILPQGLVEGAINVASSAYSTARKALNNLRGTEADSIKDFDPVFENNFALLVEMGFTNFERNARLLKRFNNDINQVIGAICATSGSNSLEID